MDRRSILTVDVGNTAVKVAVFEGERLVQSIVGSADVVETVEAILPFCSVDGISCCSVAGDVDEIGSRLGCLGLPVICLTPSTPLPIEVEYSSRATLGADRVAAAVGVAAQGMASIVVDAGTAVTVDIVADLCFKGGNISPGLRLRFRSLSEFTSRLPLVQPEGRLPLFGDDTETAIRAGVVRGLVSELDAAWRAARDLYANITMILTGGDASLLAPLLSQRGIDVSADAEAVGRGLVRIFNYNN